MSIKLWELKQGIDRFSEIMTENLIYYKYVLIDLDVNLALDSAAANKSGVSMKSRR